MVGRLIFLGSVLVLSAVGCGDSEGGGSETGGSGGTGATASGGAGNGAAVGGTGGAGASSAGGDGGMGGSGAAGGDGGMGGSGGGGTMCTAALEDALGPIAMVSTGAVNVLDDTAGVKTLFIDASAGGFGMSDSNPWVYVDLDAGARVDVTDVEAFEDASWDLAIKRPILRTNSGVSGPGNGGAELLDGVEFDTVDLADAQAATLATEEWFDDECNLATDPTGAILTTFDGWYDYQGMSLSPHPGTWIVAGGDGALYKVEILDYYADPDGTPGGLTSARYLVRVASLD